LRYKRAIDDTMTKVALEEALLERYGYSLLNYATAIVDVLSGQSHLDRTLSGLMAGDVSRMVSALEGIRKEISLAYEDRVAMVFTDIGKGLRGISDQVNVLIGLLSGTAKFLGGMFPSLNPRKRAVLPHVPSQIALLWSEGMRDGKERICWTDCVALFVWFEKQLENARYFNKYGAPEPPELKRQYRRQKRWIRHFDIWKGLSKCSYFPPLGELPKWPNTFVSLDGRAIFCPIHSIAFYSEKIRVVFELEKASLEKNFIFDGTEFRLELREHRAPQENEHHSLLLKIER